MEPAAYKKHGPDAESEDQFIRWAEQQLMKCKPDMAEDLAHDLVTRQYQEFIENEGIEFGDSDWHWSESGAGYLVDEILYPVELDSKRRHDNG